MKSFQQASKEVGVCAETIVNYTKKGWLKKNEHYVEKGEGISKPIRYLTDQGEKELQDLLKNRKHKRFYHNTMEQERVGGGRRNGKWVL